MIQDSAFYDEGSLPDAAEISVDAKYDYTMQYLRRTSLVARLPGQDDVAPELHSLGDFVLARAESPVLADLLAARKKSPALYWRLTLVERNPSEKKALAPQRLMRLHAPNADFARQAGQQTILVLLIPEAFFAGAGQLDATYPIEDKGLGALLGDFLLSLEHRLPMTGAAPSLAEAMGALLAACLAPIVPRQPAGLDPASPLLFDRICRHVHDNLRAPNLGPAQLCHELGVSRSRLYRLFEGVGGVAAYIQLQRLQQARVELAEGLPRPVSQIAEEFGFKDASGFSRSFKKQFGFSPTEARRRAAPGLGRLNLYSRPAESFER